MGMKNWLDKIQNKLDEKLRQAEDPEFQKQLQKKTNKKMADRAVKAINLARQGLDKYQKTAQKVDELKIKAAKKGSEIAEKIKPAAGVVDAGVIKAKQKLKIVFNNAVEKARQRKRDRAARPSTGSRFLDAFLPAIPETEETTRRKPKPPQLP